MINAVIFDMDGLILDSERMAIRMWVEAGEQGGYPITKEMARGAIGMDVKDTEALFISLLGPEFPFQRMNRLRRDLTEETMDREGMPIKTGAREIISIIHRRSIPLGVASATETGIVSTYLDKADLKKYFSHIVGGDQVKIGKPDPAVYLLTADKLGVAPAECLVFEDSEKGLGAAHAAGMKPILIPDILPPTEEMLKKCFERFSSLQEVIPHLDRLL